MLKIFHYQSPRLFVCVSTVFPLQFPLFLLPLLHSLLSPIISSPAHLSDCLTILCTPFCLFIYSSGKHPPGQNLVVCGLTKFWSCQLKIIICLQKSYLLFTSTAFLYTPFFVVVYYIMWSVCLFENIYVLRLINRHRLLQ